MVRGEVTNMRCAGTRTPREEEREGGEKSQGKKKVLAPSFLRPAGRSGKTSGTTGRRHGKPGPTYTDSYDSDRPPGATDQPFGSPPGAAGAGSAQPAGPSSNRSIPSRLDGPGRGGIGTRVFVRRAPCTGFGTWRLTSPDAKKWRLEPRLKLARRNGRSGRGGWQRRLVR